MSELVFAPGTSVPNLTKEIAESSGTRMVSIRIDRFQDGEVRVQILEEVRGKTVCIVQSMCGQVNAMLIETILLADAAWRAGARKIMLLSPYMAYMRQDRKDTQGTPISAQVISSMLSHAHIDNFMACDLHAKQNQGFFQKPMDEFFAGDVFMPLIKEQFDLRKVALVAPDAGAIKNVRRYAESLKVPYVFIEKERLAPESVAAHNLYGDVADKHAIIIDDMTASGGTLITAANVLKSSGATSVSAFVTHALLTKKAISNIQKDTALKTLYCTDSIDNSALLTGGDKIQIVSLADYFATNVRCIYEHGKLSSYFT